jgi:hypothetical protein
MAWCLSTRTTLLCLTLHRERISKPDWGMDIVSYSFCLAMEWALWLANSHPRRPLYLKYSLLQNLFSTGKSKTRNWEWGRDSFNWWRSRARKPNFVCILFVYDFKRYFTKYIKWSQNRRSCPFGRFMPETSDLEQSPYWEANSHSDSQDFDWIWDWESALKAAGNNFYS